MLAGAPNLAWLRSMQRGSAGTGYAEDTGGSCRPGRILGHRDPPSGRGDHSHGHLSTAEVADILHVSPKTVSRWAKDGKLRS